MNATQSTTRRTAYTQAINLTGQALDILSDALDALEAAGLERAVEGLASTYGILAADRAILRGYRAEANLEDGYVQLMVRIDHRPSVEDFRAVCDCGWKGMERKVWTCGPDGRRDARQRAQLDSARHAADTGHEQRVD